MKKKILVSRRVFEETLTHLRCHFEVLDNQEDEILTPRQLAQALAGCDGALVTLTDRIDEDLLAKCPRLQVVCNIAVGYNNIDLDACNKYRVMATNTPGVLDDTTADFTWALILATARRVIEGENYIREGRWKKWELQQLLGLDIHHATLGIIGLGRIGQAVAKRAQGFDMNIIYYDPRRASAAVESKFSCRYVELEELLRQADIVTLHVPLSQETRHLIGKKEIKQMKKTAVLINAARGGIVDDAALVAALQEGRIAGAGLDVFEGEPDLHPGFLKLPQVVVTPHIASSSAATRLKMAQMAAANLVAALQGEVPPNLLNPDVPPKLRPQER
jgi:lactate dehydrogenase-like 2-hydroxyacid dehydrogenase